MAVSTPKSVLITGCSPGSIGDSLAREFLKRKYTVCATALPFEKLSELESLGVHTYPLDVTSEKSVTALKDEVSRDLGGRLDVLINCAGMNYVMPTLDIDLAELQRTFDINLFGVVRMVKAFAPCLMATKGSIANIGSLAAYAPYVFGASYNASKAALLAYGNTLRIELSPWGVNVLTVLAGPVVSGLMTRNLRSLPADSLFAPIRTFFEQRTTHAKHGVAAMPTAEFSRRVADRLCRENAAPPRTLWVGPWRRVVWLLETFGLMGAWSLFFRRKFGLDVLEADVKGATKAA